MYLYKPKYKGRVMAIVKTGEKLVKRTFYAELEDWQKFGEMAKRKNHTTGQYLRVWLARIVKLEEEKIKAKPVLEQSGEAQN